MELRDIKYLKSLNPIEFLDKPSKVTVEFLAKFTKDPNFVALIKQMRSYYNYPETGIDLTPFVGKNFSDTLTEENVLLKDTLYLSADRLRENVGLNSDFTQQLYLLIYFNSFIDVDYYEGFITDKVDFAVTKKQIIPKLLDYKQEVATIFIPYTMSFNTFIKQAKEVWNNLQDEIDKNLTDNPYELRLHKNTELAVEITRLKDTENKTFSEISQEIFSKTDGTNEKLSDEKYIKKLYYDYKMLWLKPKPPEVPKS